MENRTVLVEEKSSSQGPVLVPNISQHYQQHFQQHYAATGQQILPASPTITPIDSINSPNINSIKSTKNNINNQYNNANESLVEYDETVNFNHQTPTPLQLQSGPTSSFESRSMYQTNSVETPLLGTSPVNNIQHHKKTVQTTTTTTTTQEPALLLLEDSLFTPPVEFQTVTPLPITYSAVSTTNNQIQQNPEPYSIHVEHLPQEKTNRFNWNNADTYLHIFLTFYFGHFAAILFFDGILRSIASLYTLKHTNVSPLIYITHIIFSICLIAFVIWFMTQCWRWWRNKSLEPANGSTYYDYSQQKPLRLRDKESLANNYVFLAAIVLIIGFFIYLIIGLVDINFKKEQEAYYKIYTHFNTSAYIGDWFVLIFRLIFWIVGIVATLLLSRNVLIKHLCPSKQIKINKEKPHTVYEVRD